LCLIKTKVKLKLSSSDLACQIIGNKNITYDAACTKKDKEGRKREKIGEKISRKISIHGSVGKNLGKHYYISLGRPVRVLFVPKRL
jgi:hypothetical protein